MKGKRKFVIAISVLSVALVVAIGSIIGVLAAFNATTGSGFNVLLEAAPNVEAEIACKYDVLHINDTEGYGNDASWYKNFTTVAPEEVEDENRSDKIIFSQDSDTESTASKSFNTINASPEGPGYTFYVAYEFYTLEGLTVTIDDNDLKRFSSNLSVSYYLIESYIRDDIEVPGVSLETIIEHSDSEYNLTNNKFDIEADDSSILLVVMGPVNYTQDTLINGNISFNLTPQI
jgi:hypothetical protein